MIDTTVIRVTTDAIKANEKLLTTKGLVQLTISINDTVLIAIGNKTSDGEIAGRV